MNNSRWDNEMKRFIAEFTEFENKISRNLNAEKVIIQQKKQAIFQYQTTLNKIHDKCSRLAKSKLSVSPRLTAIIHWSNIITEKTLKLYDRKCSIWTLTMWHNLIKTRLIGHQTSQDFFMSTEELRMIAERHNLLRQAENQLASQLVKLTAQRKELIDSKKILATKMSNLDAAMSIQTKIAQNPQKIHDSPMVKQMNSYINWLTLPIRSTTEKGKLFQKNYREAAQKTSAVITYCRDLAIADVSNGMIEIDRSDLSNLKQELNKIDHLYSEMEHSISSVFKDDIPSLKPVIFRNNGATRV